MNQDVPYIMKHAGRVTYNLDTLTGSLGSFTNQLNNLPLRETMDNVEYVTANLNRFSDPLNDQKSSLGLLMNDPELYNRLTRISADVDSLIVDIQRNPKRYISIKLF